VPKFYYINNMKLCSVKSFIYIYIYSKTKINAKNCCSKICCCCKNKDIKKEIDDKEKDKKDNKNQINNFGGVSGLIGKLENNKVTFNINTGSGLKKIAETVDDYNGEFNYENVKNLKIKLLGLELDPDTIESYIENFSHNLKYNKKISFLKGKLTKAISKENGNCLIYNFNNSRYYLLDKTDQGKRFILNVHQQTKAILKYGIYYDGIYFKLEENHIDEGPEKQEEYKKCFLEGK